MTSGEGGYEGPREVRRNPSIEQVDTALRKAIDDGVAVLHSHEPIIKEVRDAFVNLGERIREAEETREEIARLEQGSRRDQEEINAVLRGAEMTRQVLLRAIVVAIRERGL